MVAFVEGFLAAVMIFVALVGIAHSIEQGGAEDYFKVYYEKDPEHEYRIVVPKYGRAIRGPMAKDIYRWLTKGLKGDEKDE